LDWQAKEVNFLVRKSNPAALSEAPSQPVHE